MSGVTKHSTIMTFFIFQALEGAHRHFLLNYHPGSMPPFRLQMLYTTTYQTPYKVHSVSSSGWGIPWAGTGGGLMSPKRVS